MKNNFLVTAFVFVMFGCDRMAIWENNKDEQKQEPVEAKIIPVIEINPLNLTLPNKQHANRAVDARMAHVNCKRGGKFKPEVLWRN